MDIFWTELTVLLCLFIGNILFGSLPSLIDIIVAFFSKSEEEWNRRLKLSTFLLFAGAGIFIADSFVVLLPKTNREFAKSSHHSHELGGNSSDAHSGHLHDSIPIPEFIILCSFFLAYVGQEITFYILTKVKKTSKIFIDNRVSYCTCAKRHTECSRTFKDAKADQTLYGLEKKLQVSSRIQTVVTAETNTAQPAETTAKSELLRSSILAQPLPNYGTVTNIMEPPVNNPLPILQSPILLANENRIAIEHHNEAKHQNKFLINSILITIALSLQYIFLGIHIGLEVERLHQFSYLFIICLQNFILNFSAGCYLLIGNLKSFYISLIIGLISFISPVGLAIVMLKKCAVQEVPHIVKGIVFAIACGTLLYTIFCGMLRHKNFECVNGLTKFLAVLTGASSMIGLQYLISSL